MYENLCPGRKKLERSMKSINSTYKNLLIGRISKISIILAKVYSRWQEDKCVARFSSKSSIDSANRIIPDRKLDAHWKDKLVCQTMTQLTDTWASHGFTFDEENENYATTGNTTDTQLIISFANANRQKCSVLNQYMLSLLPWRTH